MSQVAIIGAGLSGLALALALHQQSISCTVYEGRPDAPLNIGGAIMLSPNALRILDHLGVYERIRPLGYNFTYLDYRDVETDKVTDVQEFGGKEKYGYDALRIYRTELIDTLLASRWSSRLVSPLFSPSLSLPSLLSLPFCSPPLPAGWLADI
jgi:2-polyprenyl-6-methoxyphenol hydroxylase-like FAD-dependent oxidoreductase